MKNLFIALFTILSITSIGQNNSLDLQRVLRVNVLNPGIEYEFPVSKKAVFAINPGIGWNSSYMSSRSPIGDPGLTHFISPFLDIEYKNIYNRDARTMKSQNIAYNSGNYWGIRLLTKFQELNIGTNDRESPIDFGLSPTWGVQRAYGKFHLLFEIAPTYFFDMKGHHYFFPMIQFNIGFNLNK